MYLRCMSGEVILARVAVRVTAHREDLQRQRGLKGDTNVGTRHLTEMCHNLEQCDSWVVSRPHIPLKYVTQESRHRRCDTWVETGGKNGVAQARTGQYNTVQT